MHATRLSVMAMVLGGALAAAACSNPSAVTESRTPITVSSGGDPLSVIITGPYINYELDHSVVGENQTCTYTADPEGGAGGYGYQWERRDGAWTPLGTDQSENVAVGSSIFFIRVTVTDANEDEASYSIKVIPEEPDLFNSCS